MGKKVEPLPDQLAFGQLSCNAEDKDTFFKFVHDNGKVALHVAWWVPDPRNSEKPMLTFSDAKKVYSRLDPSGQSQWDIRYNSRKRLKLTEYGQLSFGSHALECYGYGAEKYMLKQCQDMKAQ